MSNFYVGQIDLFGGNFAPKGWALCNGQLMSIAQNQALFSLLGTFYGGDGVTTFALPNLQSRLPVHEGQGPGLSPYPLGGTGGVPNVTITNQSMPQHLHVLQATDTLATTATIDQTVLPGQPTTGTTPGLYAAQQEGLPVLQPQKMAAGACGLTGGNQPHTNLMPSLCVTFIIALQGIFPSRN